MGIRIGVSACLLGTPCRYDGRSKPCPLVRDVLSTLAELIPICPECECGLGCPRIAMDLRQTSPDSPILMTGKDGVEHAESMRAWIRQKLPTILNLDGFVLKARSPSCGLGDAPLNGGPQQTDGLFAAAIRQRFSPEVLANEEAFHNPEDCRRFVARLGNHTLLQKIEACARDALANSPACHDWDHTLRVLNNARKIVALTKHIQPTASINEMIVDVAAMLHDIGRPQELQDQGKTNHATIGAALAMDILHQLGIQDDDFCQKIAHCIRAHRFRKRTGSESPASLEAKILFDADKLDGIGAIGIGRSFHFAGRVGARVHNRTEEALSSDSYSREDSAYREYLVKLRHVKDQMMTPAGKTLAQKRHDFMVQFFDELNQECFENQ